MNTVARDPLFCATEPGMERRESARYRVLMDLTRHEIAELHPEARAIWERLVRGGWYVDDLVAMIDAYITPLILPDEEIDFWGGVYLANPAIAQLGISFEQFLAQPRELLPAATYSAVISLTDFIDRLPLMPKQRAVQERLDAADAGQMSFHLDQPQHIQEASA